MINLRGVKESGRIFAIPTYFFVVIDVRSPWARRSSATSRATLGHVVDPPPFEHVGTDAGP